MAPHLDLVDLLAHLDHVIANQREWPLRGGRQAQHITDILHKVSKELRSTLGIVFAVSTIRSRLWGEFSALRTYSSDHWPMVFRRGSEEFKHLSNSDRKAIADRREGLLLLKVSTEGNTRRLRSREVARYSPIQDITRRRTISEDGIRKNITRSNPGNKKHISKYRPQKSTRESTQTPLSSSRASEIAHPTLAIPTIEVDETPVSSPLSDITKEVSDIYSPRVSADENQEVFSIDGSDRGLEANAVCPKVFADTYTISELAYLKQSRQKLEAEVKDLKDERRRIDSKLRQDHGISFQQINGLRTETKEVISLKAQVERLKVLQPFFRHGGAQNKEPVLNEIFSCSQDLKEYLPTFLFAENTTKISLVSLCGRSQDLDNLLLHVFKQSEEASLKSTLKVASPVTVQEISQALLGAAIHCWIFREKFTLPGIVITPILQQYRDLIADLAGTEHLHSLDLAVHESMIAERTFEEETLPRIVETIGARFLRVLDTFYKAPKIDLREELSVNTEQILRCAVKLRAYSLIAGSDFILQYPSPKSAFVAEEMEILNYTQSITNTAVRLTIFPGIHVHTKQKSMVTYEGFDTDIAGKDKPEHVIKALVLS